MTDDQQNLYDLSRRKMIAGLGAIGLASAGAGLGTSALFSDREEFSDNSITAGTLDLSVTATVVGANAYWADQPGVLGLSGTADDSEAVVGLTVDDVKPGDWAIICFEIENETNPGYVQVSVTDLENGEGANPEPEGDTTGDGELGDAILASLWQAYGGPTDGTSSGQKSDLSVLDAWTNDEPDGTVNKPYAAVSDDDYTSAEYGQTVESDMDYPTLNQFASFLGGGQLIRKNDGTPFYVTNDGADRGDGAAEFCLLLEIPTAVGNDIQGDTVSFDLVFETEQVRNNDDPFNGTQVTPSGTPTPS
ncbi:SipW-dependent-type signal peptide-containing protein [Halorarius halobius]|uniref:SipW-dependent-type signal peptide-containing protein n=1 Tax=Halorarius halobius TaxID=2962671 RepID=UPI0020CEFB0C|nr:SipW-dependent-type signal peptide-containing protein [Halorarius halobius]